MIIPRRNNTSVDLVERGSDRKPYFEYDCNEEQCYINYLGFLRIYSIVSKLYLLADIPALPEIDNIFL